jgi:hypothetical protein
MLQLVLDPSLGLLSGSAPLAQGVLKNRLLPPAEPGRASTAELVAPDLRVAKDSTKLVTITVDDFKRAFLFQTTFPTATSQPKATQILGPALRLSAPAAADPQKPVLVHVEADNLKDGQQVILELLTLFPGRPEVPTERTVFHGERTRKLAFTLGTPNGGIILQPLVEDLRKELDLSGQVGKRRLRLRLLPENFKPGEEDKSLLDFVDTASLGTKREIVQDIILDSTPPIVVSVGPDVPAYRDRTLTVQAVGRDPESGIREAIFFAGKPMPDGSIPQGAATVRGTLIKPAKGEPYWEGKLDVPADQKGRFLVTVRFVNNVGLTENSEPKAFEVRDPPPDLAKKASIAGMVREGDRPQPGLTVVLRNAAGQTLATQQPKPDGSYLFEGLDPGQYQVSSSFPAINISGQTPVIPLTAGEQKTNQDIKLRR